MWRFARCSVAAIMLLIRTALPGAASEVTTVTDLGTLGGRHSDAAHINDAGQIVVGREALDGTYDGIATGFIWDNDMMIQINPPQTRWISIRRG